MKGAHLRLTEDLGQSTLEGSRCPQCGDTFYPPREVCLSCYHQGLDPVALSRTGSVYTFTIARLAPPKVIVQAPYVIAQVQLPENVTIATILTEIDPRDVRIGMLVELVVEKASVNSEGAEVITFKFRPAKEG